MWKGSCLDQPATADPRHGQNKFYPSYRLDMEMLIHRGSGVGLHQHLLNHMGVKSYKELTNTLNKANKFQKATFVNKLRGGYSTYFSGAPDFDEIMEIIDSGLEGCK